MYKCNKFNKLSISIVLSIVLLLSLGFNLLLPQKTEAVSIRQVIKSAMRNEISEFKPGQLIPILLAYRVGRPVGGQVYSLSLFINKSFIIANNNKNDYDPSLPFDKLSPPAGGSAQPASWRINSGQANDDNRRGNRISASLISQDETILPPPLESAEKKEKVISKKWVIITAYSSTPDQTDSTPFITASNAYVYDGVVAANFLPFGTKIKIPSLFGNKIFTVEDRMKSNKKVDIWFPTRELARNFGVRRAEIEILANL